MVTGQLQTLLCLSGGSGRLIGVGSFGKVYLGKTCVFM